MIKRKLLLIVALLFWGCSSLPVSPPVDPPVLNRPINKTKVIGDPSKALPKMPSVKYGKETLTDVAVKRSLKIKVYNWHYAVFPDKYYNKVEFSSFIEFNKWFKESTRQIWRKQLGDGYDCDNFAALYRGLMGVSSYKSSNTKQLLVGVIYVKHEHEFGGIAAGGKNAYHALNIVGTTDGWVVYEPQTGLYDKLENYKNKIIWYLF